MIHGLISDALGVKARQTSENVWRRLDIERLISEKLIIDDSDKKMFRCKPCVGMTSESTSALTVKEYFFNTS